MQFANGTNILDVSHQLSFTYKGLALLLLVFILPTVGLTKTSEFILQLEEKRECLADFFFFPSPRYTSQFSPQAPIIPCVFLPYSLSLPPPVEE